MYKLQEMEDYFGPWGSLENNFLATYIWVEMSSKGVDDKGMQESVSSLTNFLESIFLFLL